MSQTEIEARLLALEAEVQLLKSQGGVNKADPKWVLAHAGRFADDPGFDEVVRLGREYRESLRPKAKPKPKKPAANRKPKPPVKNGRA